MLIPAGRWAGSREHHLVGSAAGGNLHGLCGTLPWTKGRTKRVFWREKKPWEHVGKPSMLGTSWENFGKMVLNGWNMDGLNEIWKMIEVTWFPSASFSSRGDDFGCQVSFHLLVQSNSGDNVRLFSHSSSFFDAGPRQVPWGWNFAWRLCCWFGKGTWWPL